MYKITFKTIHSERYIQNDTFKTQQRRIGWKHRKEAEYTIDTINDVLEINS